MECDAEFRELESRVLSGTLPYDDAEECFAVLLSAIAAFRERCSVVSAEYLHALVERQFGRVSTQAAVDRFRAMGSDPQCEGRLRLKAYARAAALSFKAPEYSPEQNYAIRREAVAVADSLDLQIEGLVLLVNWLFAAVTLEDWNAVELLIPQIERRLAQPPEPKDEIERARLLEVQFRLPTHKAKYLLRRTSSERGTVPPEMTTQANELYATAVKIISSAPVWDDRARAHRRVNVQLEWAQHLAASAAQDNESDQQVEELLDAAYRSFDSHPCDDCRAYYYRVKAEARSRRGDLIYDRESRSSVDSWREALMAAKRSVQIYLSHNHHLAGESQELVTNMEKKIASATRPSMIFLSHKTADKDLVLRFYRALQALGLAPWLDEEHMPAGTVLTRGIADGIENSCACVFFVTPNFADERYIRHEIDLASRAAIERPTDFRIITLGIGQGVTIPASLKMWIYKETISELDALTAIIKALPVKVGTPYWPISVDQA